MVMFKSAQIWNALLIMASLLGCSHKCKFDSVCSTADEDRLRYHNIMKIEQRVCSPLTHSNDVSSRLTTTKTQSSVSVAVCVGNLPVIGGYIHKGPVIYKTFQSHDVIIHMMLSFRYLKVLLPQHTQNHCVNKPMWLLWQIYLIHWSMRVVSWGQHVLVSRTSSATWRLPRRTPHLWIQRALKHNAIWWCAIWFIDGSTMASGNVIWYLLFWQLNTRVINRVK